MWGRKRLSSCGNTMTDYQVKELAHRVCWRYKASKNPKDSDTYTFNEQTLLEFARILKLMDNACEVGKGKDAAN